MHIQPHLSYPLVRPLYFWTRFLVIRHPLFRLGFIIRHHGLRSEKFTKTLTFFGRGRHQPVNRECARERSGARRLTAAGAERRPPVNRECARMNANESGNWAGAGAERERKRAGAGRSGAGAGRRGGGARAERGGSGAERERGGAGAGRGYGRLYSTA
jgi:hypothetical protein